MDLKQYTMRDTTRVNLVDPSGEPLIDPDNGEQLWIEVRGSHTKEVREVENKLINQRFKEQAKQRRMEVEPTEWLEARALDKLVAATVAWSQSIVYEKQSLQCNAENARKIYTEFPFIRRQVDEVMDAETAYMGKV